MSFQLAKTIANVEQKIAAKATSANRRGLLIQDAGTYKSVAINLHACKDALTAAYEWFLQSYLRPLYTEILFAFPEGIGGTIRLPLLNIRFPNFLTVGNYSSFKGAVSPTG